MMPRSVLSGMVYILTGLAMCLVAIAMHELRMPAVSVGAVAIAGAFMLLLGLCVVNYPGGCGEPEEAGA